MPSFICRPSSLAGPVNAALIPSVITGLRGLAGGITGGGVREGLERYQANPTAATATPAPIPKRVFRRETSRPVCRSGRTLGGGGAAETRAGGLMLTTRLVAPLSLAPEGRGGRGAGPGAAGRRSGAAGPGGRAA